MKESRRDRIRELAAAGAIETQHGLAKRLAEEGYQVTQATLSRDIRALRLMKTTGRDGRQYYCLPEAIGAAGEGTVPRMPEGAVRTMDTAGNLLVIHTASGMAMAVAAVLDQNHIPRVVGCIAGDDTVFVAAKSDADARALMKHIQKLAEG